MTKRVTDRAASEATIAAAALDGFCVIDADGRIVQVNDSFCEISGYSRDELLGMAIAQFEVIESPEEVDVHRARVLEGRADRFDTKHRRKDGSVIDVAISLHVHPDDPAAIVGFVRDITNERTAEREAARTTDLLVNLARLVPGVIYQYRLYPDGRSAFPYSSPGMELIYEVTPDDVQVDATPVFGRLHPDDYTMVASAIEASARTLQMFFCEFRVVLPRQGLRWRWSQAQPQRMDDGSTLWHGIILDIHDRKTAQLEKAALEEQLQQAQKMESVGRLAGGVAHDFNNMLGVILGYVGFALDQVPAPNPLREDLEEIHKAATRSAELTRQLLAFARRQVIAPKVLDLNSTVSGLVAMLQRLIGEGVRLEWKPGADIWSVRVDPSQIDQILANLCINARDAMNGTGQLTIAASNVSLEEANSVRFGRIQPGDYVRLAVVDTGCGMDQQTQSRLFEPFFTTKAMGKGTGLGLSTVYGIVKQNGGYVAVESSIGKGTTMAVYLPRHVGALSAECETEGEDLPPTSQETVLLVEDEPAMLEMTTRVLRGMGYRVVAVGSAEDALRIARERGDEIRVLLTDVVMPDMNGRDLATVIAARHPHIAVVFMSGYTADVIASQGVPEGVVFLEKPFTKEALAFKLSEALRTVPTPPIH
jgi:two-component system, cell cycle sensor histidine kinase and response regulator CckA